MLVHHTGAEVHSWYYYEVRSSRPQSSAAPRLSVSRIIGTTSPCQIVHLLGPPPSPF